MNRLQKLDASLVKSAIVEKVDGRWVLWTKDKSRRLGTHNTAREAYAQEYAIEKSQEREAKKASADAVDEPSFIARLLQREGGDRKVTVDSGGVTKGGIAASGGVFTPKQIRNLQPAQINQFWHDKLQLSAPIVNPGVREILFDMEANMGPRAWMAAREQANAMLPKEQQLRVRPSAFDPEAAARVNGLDQDTYAANLMNAFKLHHQGLVRKNPGVYKKYEGPWKDRRKMLWDSPAVTPLHKVTGPPVPQQPAPQMPQQPAPVKTKLPAPPAGYQVVKSGSAKLDAVGDSDGVVEAEVCKCEGPCTCTLKRTVTKKAETEDPTHNKSEAPPASSVPTVPDGGNKINSAYDLKSRIAPLSDAAASGNKALTIGPAPFKQSSLWFGNEKLNLDFSPKTTSGSDAGFLQRYLFANGTRFGQNKGLLPMTASNATIGLQMIGAPLLNQLALPMAGATLDKALGRPGTWRQNFARYLPTADMDKNIGYFTKGWTSAFGAPYQTSGSVGDIAYDATRPLAPVVLDTKEQLYKMLGIGQ